MEYRYHKVIDKNNADSLAKMIIKKRVVKTYLTCGL